MTSIPSSPRITALQAQITAGNSDALAQFWHEVIEQGTPFVEPIEGDNTHSLVTFLWRAEEPIENVLVMGGFADWDKFDELKATHLLDTDLWYKTHRLRNDIRTTYQFAPNDPLTPFSERESLREELAKWKIDQFNPRTFLSPKDEEDPIGREWRFAVLELPAATPQPWIVKRDNIPSGRVEMHRVKSGVLKNERRVCVYTPPGYTPNGEPYHLFVLFDGFSYTQTIPTPTIVDNLIAEGRIPPLVVVMLNNPNIETRNRELPCYPPFVEFLTQELLPWVHERYHVTTDPAQTIVGGSSYGGLAATFAGFSAPETFGNVLSQSGSFWWKPNYNEPEGEHEWLTRQFATSPTRPVRFYLDVGLLERGGSPNYGPNQVVANRHMRDVLQAKGYQVHYAEFNGGHEYLCWQGTLADGLLALLEK